MIKRLFDIFLSISLLIILSPIMLLLCVLIWFSSGNPVIFKQKRLGKDENEFIIYKYRTMKNTRCENSKLLPDEDRAFYMGSLMRKLSLDELPQLWNILKGDMTFVGPRALLVEYKEVYSSEERRRHSVRPGITGLAQVNGRNSLTWKEKFQYDLHYIDNMSCLLDLKILLKTPLVLINTKGVNRADGRPAEKYNGRN